MAHNTSPEKLRREVLRSPVRDFMGYRLAFDCGSRACWGERTISLRAVAAKLGEDATVAHVITRLRCAGCKQQPRAVHLETGPEAASCGPWRRFPLQGLFLLVGGRT